MPSPCSLPLPLMDHRYGCQHPRNAMRSRATYTTWGLPPAPGYVVFWKPLFLPTNFEALRTRCPGNRLSVRTARWKRQPTWAPLPLSGTSQSMPANNLYIGGCAGYGRWRSGPFLFKFDASAEPVQGNGTVQVGSRRSLPLSNGGFSGKVWYQ